VTRALVLAGHGSHLDPRSSAPIYAHAAAIRERACFDEVAVSFWKEEPPFSRFLEVVDARDITVVPVFMAAGHFTDRVIPREMGLSGRSNETRGRTVRYTSPVGCHPGIVDIVEARALEAGATPGALVAVIGHGTPKHAKSAGTTVAVAEALRQRGHFRDAVAVFLDQEPSIATLADCEPPVVAVPLFVADGWHAGVQVPGIAGEAVGEGLVYALPAGLHPHVADIIVELATEAAAWR